VLELRGVSKRFAGVQALDRVDFGLAEGEVHALLGENGAGKSTLIKLMTGVHAPDAGEILLDGRVIRPRSPADALRLGVGSVYQEVNLLPNLSVAHNLYLGREPRRLGSIRWRRLYADARRLLERFGLDIDVRESLGSFSIAVQQLVAIARGVDCSARVLVLDEPTASLDASEVSLLFGVMGELKRAGMALVFVTHFLDQVYAVADRITVLRNGTRVVTSAAADLPRAGLVAAMLGRELETVEQERSPEPVPSNKPPVIEARGLGADNGLVSASFSAREGEAVGLAGLLGSGRTELCEALFGLASRTAGELTVAGRAPRLDSPVDAIRDGLALCPEDRKTAGVVAALSIRENIAIALQARRGWWHRLPAALTSQLAERTIRDLGIVCRDADEAVETLSGGNQQRVVLGRWLATAPKILILDEPTRGIDVGAHAAIVRLIRRLREQGLTVLIASSEIDELVAFSDQVLVMREGRSVAALEGEAISEPAIVAAIAGAA
jgi:monosaccharide-transporting ATPase